jgi:hypothetical protein
MSKTHSVDDSQSVLPSDTPPGSDATTLPEHAVHPRVQVHEGRPRAHHERARVEEREHDDAARLCLSVLRRGVPTMCARFFFPIWSSLWPTGGGGVRVVACGFGSCDCLRVRCERCAAACL